MADTSIEIVLGMPFLTLLNVDMQFVEKKHKQKSYTNAEVLPTTKRVELINKREFVAATLDKNAETYVIHVVILSMAPTMQVHPLCQAQVGQLLTDKAPIKVPPEYLDYADVFLFDFAMELPENTDMNEHVIKLIEGKQPPYGLIYSLKLVELETLKTYIETYLKTGFIQPSKSPASAPILFN